MTERLNKFQKKLYSSKIKKFNSQKVFEKPMDNAWYISGDFIDFINYLDPKYLEYEKMGKKDEYLALKSLRK